MNFKYCLIFLLSLFVIASCSTLPKPSEQTNKESTKVVKLIEKDTVFLTKKDSSFYKAYIECVNGVPVLTPPKNKTGTPDLSIPKKTKGRHLEPPNVNLNGNVLSVGCKAKAQRLFATWKERFVQEQTTTTKTITLPQKIVEKQLSWWQKLWIALGKILALLLVLFILTKISWKNLFTLLLRLVKRG